MKLNPKTNPEFAGKLSSYIMKYSKQFGTDWRHSVAIAMQESAFENKNRYGTVMTKKGRLISGVTDVGVFQIHVRTIAAFGINPSRLERDVEYQTYWHTKILAQKVKTCSKNRKSMEVKSGNEWSCYHSFTYEKRQVYLADVTTHLSKILH
jgi:hypothetical protein